MVGEMKRDLTYHLLKYLKKKYDLQTIGFFLVNKYRELSYTFHVLYELKRHLLRECLLEISILLTTIQVMMFISMLNQTLKFKTKYLMVTF